MGSLERVTVVRTVFGFLEDLAVFLESDFAAAFGVDLACLEDCASLLAENPCNGAPPNTIRLTQAKSQNRFKRIPNCLPKLLTYRIINNFYSSANLIHPHAPETHSAIVATEFDCRALTNTTPVIVRAKPPAINIVKGSSNRSQAIAAVVGGVK